MVPTDCTSNPLLAFISVDGLQFMTLVDTGAAITILNADVAEMLNTKTKPTQGLLQMAEKSAKIPKKITAAPLTLSYSNVTLQTTLNVFQPSDDTPIILGRHLPRAQHRPHKHSITFLWQTIISWRIVRSAYQNWNSSQTQTWRPKSQKSKKTEELIKTILRTIYLVKIAI